MAADNRSRLMARPLRFGILGAARIAPNALLRPARRQPDLAVVTAIAARDPRRAHRMADRYGIPRTHDSYRALIDDPDVDVVYNPLPNSLHAPWTIAALEAGKHVLCEKPLASNAHEAEQIAATARRVGLVAMEAFHYRYHPLTLRLLAARDEIGPIRRIETTMCIPNFRFSDIRYRYDLAGGALMDVGCYAIHLLRTLAGAEGDLVSADVQLISPRVDRAARAEFRFPDGVAGSIHCSMWSRTLLDARARIIGDRGEAVAVNPWLPHLFNRFSLRTPDASLRTHIAGDTTYDYQLVAFVDAVTQGVPLPTDLDDAVANMRAIDSIYRTVGLPLRGT